MRTQRVLLIAGEVSGDVMAQHVITQTCTLSPDIRFYGMAGDLAEAAGMEITWHYDSLALMGVSELIWHWRKIARRLCEIAQHMQAQPPHAVVLIDYGGFNLKVAKVAHQLNIPVFYFVPPKIWAWGAGRIKKIQRFVDHVAVIFPFEEPLYQDAGIPVSCVRHPLLDQASPPLSAAQFCKRYGLQPKQPILCVMPGSRRQEIKQLLTPMLDTCKELHTTHPTLQVVMPLAQGTDQATLEDSCHTQGVKVNFIPFEHRYAAIAHAQAAVVASGTAAFEVALLGTPMVVTYKFSALTFALVKRLVKVDYASLPNLLLNAPIVPELLQRQCHAQAIAAEVCPLLKAGSDAAGGQQAGLKQMKALLQNQQLEAGQALVQFFQAHQRDGAASSA